MFTRLLEPIIRSVSNCSTLSSESNKVRVRFAPSPTGHLHLGGLRTALYNYIFAKQNNGQFVLRIEDTDQTRIVQGSAEEIENLLNWANLRPDESPQLGGPYGPYKQSDRVPIYQEYANLLLDKRKAYRCFCSWQRLELLRNYQARNREKIRYDGKCKNLSPDQVEEKMHECREKGQHYTIRFALNEGVDKFDDLIFGTITTNLVEAKDSDPVILKSDGFPTYHFANIIDDHLMQITHVLRGSEWISSTTKHVQLYRAFGWTHPTFAHFPLITMHDGSKMSKRNDNSQVKMWAQAGYKPDTLFNFLTNSGGGVPKSKQDSNEYWTLRELIEGFRFDQVTCHPASLDMNRLHKFSAKGLQRSWSTNQDEVVAELKNLMKKRNITTDLQDTDIKRIIALLINRLISLNDLFGADYFFVWHPPTLTWSVQEYEEKNWNLSNILDDTKGFVENCETLSDNGQLQDGLRAVSAKNKLNHSEYMKFLRKLLTNSDKGLPIYELFQCLGRDRLTKYLNNGLEYVK